MREALKEKFAYFELQYLGMVRRMHERIEKSEQESKENSKGKSGGTRKKANNKEKDKKFASLKSTKSLTSLGLHNIEINEARRKSITNDSLFVPGAPCGDNHVHFEVNNPNAITTKSLPITPKLVDRKIKMTLPHQVPLQKF